MAKGKKSGTALAEQGEPAGEKDDDTKLTWVEIAARNEEIVTLKARGLSWRQVSDTAEVSVSRCKAIVAEFRASNPSLRQSDPLEIVDSMIIGYEADIAELALVSNTTKQDSVRVGAVNSRSMIRGRIVELLQATGVLPNDLGKLQVEIDARFVAITVLKVLNDHEVGDDVKKAILQALRREEGEELPLEQPAAA